MEQIRLLRLLSGSLKDVFEKVYEKHNSKIAYEILAADALINEYNNTVITLIAHKVAIHVNENGTKAAGVSAGVGIDGAMTPMPNLSFDHPFIYAVRENTTGAILFMGKVVKL